MYVLYQHHKEEYKLVNKVVYLVIVLVVQLKMKKKNKKKLKRKRNLLQILVQMIHLILKLLMDVVKNVWKHFLKKEKKQKYNKIIYSHVYVKYQELLERNHYLHMVVNIVDVMDVIQKIRRKTINQRKIVDNCHQFQMIQMNRILIIIRVLVILDFNVSFNLMDNIIESKSRVIRNRNTIKDILIYIWKRAWTLNINLLILIIIINSLN